MQELFFLFFFLEGPAVFHYEPEENKNVFMAESLERHSLILHVNFYLFLPSFIS